MPPCKILLATDLSPRCDRARDRAILLTKEFHSELIALHVAEPSDEIGGVRRVPFMPVHRPNRMLVDKAKQGLADSLASAGVNATIMVEEGDPREIILRTARNENCDLIITGVVRNRIFDHFTLGKTFKYLLRKSENPLLVVNEQASTRYEKIIVASDYSEASKYAVAAAAAFFPERYISVFHAYTAPASYAAENVENYNEQMRPAATRNFTNFLDTIDLTARQRERIRVIIEWGALTKLLRDLVSLSRTELVVTGSRNRGLLLNALFNGSTKRIVSSLSCDILIARSSFLPGR
ncbi:MAG: universal stress protein [Desulfobacterales bacterium]|nr:universal stress protein [Desulfobacterales bacterium]MDD3080674.1 universal stress protein [Desulfobacterales bacterium]MDD3949681.1 universal stress protein [Desulfobacterales bacterium]MDD4463317.1 universal stress protein [Desulfobacterales bacterium]